MKTKICTSIEQSKRLIELGLDVSTADMDYIPIVNLENEYDIQVNNWNNEHEDNWIPAWSLSALLNILNETAYFIDKDASVNLSSYKTVEWYLGINNSDLDLVTEPNPIDACYEMILRLQERKML